MGGATTCLSAHTVQGAVGTAPSTRCGAPCGQDRYRPSGPDDIAPIEAGLGCIAQLIPAAVLVMSCSGGL
jgi:hypothetical protein